MSKTTDLHHARPSGVPDNERKAKAATVLATVAAIYATEKPDSRVDDLTLTVRIGAAAYDQAGRTCHGDGPAVARLAKRLAPILTEGVTRSEYAAQLFDAARAEGWDEDATSRPQAEKAGV